MCSLSQTAWYHDKNLAHVKISKNTVVLQDIPGILNVKHIEGKQNFPVIKTDLHERHNREH